MSPRITLVALAFVVAGCSTAAAGSPSPLPSEAPSTPTAVPSQSPSEKPKEAPSAPFPSEAPESPPAPTPQPVAQFDVGPMSTIRVLVNGLAVRTAPGTGFPLLSAYRYPDQLATDRLRINSGHYLVVEHGPLIVDGMPWLQVHNVQQPGETSDEKLGWDSDGDEFHTDYGWIAGAGSDGSAFVVEDEIPRDPNEPIHGPEPEPYLILAGNGSVTTDAFVVTSPPSIDIAAADPEGGTCAMKVIVEPTGETVINQQVDRLALVGVFSESVTGTVSIRIESDCSWSLVVVPAQG